MMSPGRAGAKRSSSETARLALTLSSAPDERGNQFSVAGLFHAYAREGAREEEIAHISQDVMMDELR